MSNLAEIKKEFPIFRQKMRGKQLVYLDSAATTQKPASVINSIQEFYEKSNANIHRSIYELGEKATAMYEGARKKVADFINASPEEIIFTRGTTESINIVARLIKNRIKSGDEILITEMEHHSNLIPWQQIAKRKGASLICANISKNFEIESPAVSKKTKIFAFTHISNILGTVNDAKGLTKKAHDKGALVAIDAAQSVAHLKIDVKDIDCDFLAFSGHKMFGPTGIGVLYAKRGILESAEPVDFGGDMVKNTTFSNAKWNDLPWKFEAGTPNIEGAIALGAAIDFINGLGIEKIKKYEQSLMDYAVKRLSELKEAVIYCQKKSENRGPVVSFSFGKIHPHDVAQILDREGIAVRAGHMCAQPLVNKLGHSALCRASFSIYNTKEDIDMLVASLKKARGVFR